LHLTRLMATLLVGSAVVVTPLSAQLSPKDILALPAFPPFSRFVVSPDEKLVAFTVARVAQSTGTHPAAEEKIPDTRELWVSDFHTGRARKICCQAGSPSDPSWSPDGLYLAFFRTHAPEGRPTPSQSARAQLCLWNRKIGKLRNPGVQFTRSRMGADPPFWLNDGTSILVLASPLHAEGMRDVGRTGNPLESTETQPLGKELQHGIRVLSTTATLARSDQTAQEFKNEEEKKQREILRSDLAIIDIVGGRFQRIAKDIYPLYIALSPDRKAFVFSEEKETLPNSFFAKHDIRLVNLETRQIKTIFRNLIMYSGASDAFAWSPNGGVLAVTDQSGDGSVNNESPKAFSDWIVIDLDKGSSRRIKGESSEAWFGPRKTVWSADGYYLSFVRNHRLETWIGDSLESVSKVEIPNIDILDIVSTCSHTGPMHSREDYTVLVKTKDKKTLKEGFWRVWPESGKATMVFEDDKHFPFYSDFHQLSSDGSRLWFVWESVDHGPELYEATASTGAIKRITNVGCALEHEVMGRSQVIEWKTEDGIELKGALLLPARYQEDHRYPLIVSVYPADVMSSFKNAFGMHMEGAVDNWQLFATRGYAVLMPDIVARPTSRMKDIAKCVLPGIQRVIDLGIADSDKIAVIGHSDGGYATWSLLVQSRLFKTGVVLSGAGNMFDMYSYDYGRQVIEESQGIRSTPWASRDVFLDNSPYFFLDRIQVPVLVIHGTSDDAVPVHLADEMFNGLERLGKDGVYVQYIGENHVPAEFSFSNQMDLQNRLVAWFAKHLKGADVDSTTAVQRPGPGSQSR